MVLAGVLALSFRAADADRQHKGEQDDDDSGDSDAGSDHHKKDAPPRDAKGRAAWLSEHLNASRKAAKLGKSKVGVVVIDLTTGAELYAHDADTGMNLASNTKVLTTTAALATLGGGFHWHTAVYADKLDEKTGVVDGDLYVRGRGDPTLSVRDLRELASDIAAKGVRTVKGRIVIDASYFDDQIEPPHYDEQKNEHAGFRAPVASFGVARGTVTVVATANPDGAATVRLEPDGGDYVRITKKEVTTVTSGHTRVSVGEKIGKDHIDFEVTGQVRAADGDYELRRRLDDPSRYAAEVFRKVLADRGVTVAGKTVGKGAVPKGAWLAASHDSASLSTVIRDMNRYSDNYIAETVLKTLGAETRKSPGPATWADGTDAVAAYLRSIGVTGYRADNGSGLFGSTSVSARQMATVLAAAHKDFKIYPDLVGSLPVGGVDGTLAKRWHNRPASGRVRAKTGTLDAVITLAGYAGVDDGHLIAFAILTNDISGGEGRTAARAMADDMVDEIVTYLSP